MVFSNLFDEVQGRKRRKQQKVGTIDLESKVNLKEEPRETNTSARKKRKRPASSKGNVNANWKDSKISVEASQSNQTNSNPKHLSKSSSQGRRHSFQPLSKDVVDFSNRLKDLSRQKNLNALLELYYDKKYDVSRDEHHACIVIDSCAKCGGNIKAAEQVLAHFFQKSSSHNPSMQNVETQTALLKVYVYAGDMSKAWDLFQQIKSPNVRTLNTLLRGCLWSATSLVEHSDVSDYDKLIGGVITSEKAWKHYAEKELLSSSNNIPSNGGSVALQKFDVSSYEYAVTLLCQALRVREAEARIQEFCSTFGISFKGTAKLTCDKPDQMVMEALAVCYLSLARTFALLQNDALWSSCQRCLSAIKLSRTLLQDSSQPNSSKERNKNASGGKRGWKKSSSDGATHGRDVSNFSYREHRLSEFETEVRSLLKHSHHKSKDEGGGILDTGKFTEIVVSQLKNRFLYFSGGSVTSTCAVTGELFSQPLPDAPLNQTVLKLSQKHFIASWFSFGLSQLVSKKLDLKLVQSENDDGFSDSLGSHWRVIDSHSAGLICDDGTIDFDRAFPDSTLPLCVEIGAGFGSWIVQQAKKNLRRRNYVAVELRADRCHQILTRVLLDSDISLDNVCVVGSDCCDLLSGSIKPCSVATFYANHPEPPTQVIGDDPNYLRHLAQGRISEPVHMLTSTTILSMSNCLKKNGHIMVVSDNRSYTRLLAATFCKVIQKNKSVLQSVRHDVRNKDSDIDISLESLQHTECFQSTVDIYMYNSNTKGGASYFDRLWRTGAGSHSETHSRFVILMQRL